MRYKLVTLYSTYEIPAGDVWLVYGHYDVSVNENIGRYDTKLEALTNAFWWGVPVMMGHNYHDALMKLTAAS